MDEQENENESIETTALLGSVELRFHVETRVRRLVVADILPGESEAVLAVVEQGDEAMGSGIVLT